MALRWLCGVILGFGMWLTLPGCGGAPPPSPPPESEEIKKILTDIAEAGRPNSGLTRVESYLKDLKSEDSALATALQEDLAKLQQSQNPDEVKEIAGRMASKL
jgi:hypothetical protein